MVINLVDGARWLYHSKRSVTESVIVSPAWLLSVYSSISCRFQCCWPWPWSLILRSLVLGQFSRAPQNHTNYDMKAVKTPCDCQLDSFELALSLWHCLIKCLLRELVPPSSYFFLVVCSLAPLNQKRSLNVFWRQVLGLGLEAQVLVNNTGMTYTECQPVRTKPFVI